jgi:hypothetical protein
MSTGIGLKTMECRSLDDERRRDMCIAIFNQMGTTDVEEVCEDNKLEVIQCREYSEGIH